MQWALQIVMGLLVLSLVLSTLRLLRGPTLANRVLALDIIAVLAAALTAVCAILYDRRVFLDVTIVIALVSFVSTVAFAYYVGKRAA